MKRLIAILLCLCLMMGTAAAMAAEPVNVNFYTENDNAASDQETKYVMSATNLGDTVYMLTNQSLESWKPGDAAPTVLTIPFVTAISVSSDAENSDADTENSDADTENSDADTENSDADTEGTDEAAVATDAAATDAVVTDAVATDAPAATTDAAAVATDAAAVATDAAAVATDAAVTDAAATGKDATKGEATFDRLFSDATTVYGLDDTTGAVWKIADTSGVLAAPEAVTKLDWTKMKRHSQDQDYDYTPQFGSIALMDGVVYMSLVDGQQDRQIYELASWTFSTGALIDDKIDMPLRTLSPYQDGLLIGKYYDEANSWDEKTQTQKMPSLVTYDPATGKVTTLFDFDSSSIYGVYYSAEKNTLYYVDGSTAYSMPGLQKPAKISAYLPNRVWDDAAGLILPSGMIVISDYNGVIVRGLDMPGIEKGALSIYGEYGSPGHQAYVRENPQALVVCSEDYYNSLEQFTNSMVSGNGAMDVLELDSDYSPLRRLIQKGYALDLSGYADLKAVADTMAPNLLNLCTLDGKLYGLPISMSANSFGYNETVLEQVGLTKEDLPTTFMGLLDFVENWQDDYGEDNPDVMLMDSGAVKESLIGWLMSDYVAYLTKQGEPISFDTDLFRKLMTRIDSIDFSALDLPKDGNADAFYNRTALLTSYLNMAYPGQYRYDTKCLPISLDEGMDPIYPATLQVMIINPRTTRLDQAVQYMTTYMKNLDAASAKITLFPNNNEPIVNENFDRDLKSWKENVSDATVSLQKAKPEDKADIQSTIDYFQKMIDTSDTYRYDVSAEDIATFRNTVEPYLVVVGQNPLNTWGDDGTNQFYTLQSQYMQGAITVDQFIKEIDKRMRMIQLEDQ